MRQCPKCHVGMTPEIIGGEEVDRCDQCKGLLLDKGEIGALVRDNTGDDAAPVASLDQRDATCYACDKAMRKRSLRGVRIEACDGCGVVFLDDGELSAILAAG